jgi:hypothetical protein
VVSKTADVNLKLTPSGAAAAVSTGLRTYNLDIPESIRLALLRCAQAGR